MPTTRENYQITATEISGLVFRLNSILTRISDRLDKIEGLRTELETESGTFAGDVKTTSGVVVSDSSDNTLHSMR